MVHAGYHQLDYLSRSSQGWVIELLFTEYGSKSRRSQQDIPLAQGIRELLG